MSYSEDPVFGDDQLVLKDEPLPGLEDEPSSHHQQLEKIAMVLLKHQGDLQQQPGLTNDVDPLMDISRPMTSLYNQQPSVSAKVKLQPSTDIPMRTPMLIPIPRIPIIPNITLGNKNYVPIEAAINQRPKYIPKKPKAKVLVTNGEPNVMVNLKQKTNLGNFKIQNKSKQISSNVHVTNVSKKTKLNLCMSKKNATTISKAISDQNSRTKSINTDQIKVPPHTLQLNTNDKPFYLISESMQLVGIIRQSNLINIIPYLETVLISKQPPNTKVLSKNCEDNNSNCSNNEAEENDEQVVDDILETSESQPTKKESIVTSYPCKKCSETFTDIKDYFHHEEKHRKRRLSYTHKIPSQSRKNEVKTIIKSKETQKVSNCNYQCHICSKKLSCNKNLKIHLSKHNPNTEKPFNCKKCNRQYWTNRNLKLHCCRPIVEKRKEFQCDKCEKILTNRRSFNYHIKIKHAKLSRFYCDLCSKGYYIKSQLKNHIEVHLNISGKICDICGKILSGKGSLRYHLKTHNKERLFICHLCGYSYPNKRILDKHLYLHKGLRNFQCDICSKALTTKVAIRDHVMLHLNIKPFQCKGCNVAYSTASGLNYHNKTVHCGLHRSNLRRKEPVRQLATRKILSTDLINSNTPHRN